jgi:uncharacterized protein
MITQPRLKIHELDRIDIDALLARHHVGRLIFGWGGRIDVRPVHYVYANGIIYGRTSHGAKFIDVEELPAAVVFEIDEVESLFRWRSVIVRGEFSLVTLNPAEGSEWREAVAILKTLYRGAFATEDPVPDRTVVFRITIDEATGRGMS